ncbi:hypothetical protein IHN63_00565 [Deinococcus sp. 6YEL10]|uniref:hypothetical protein n=1 Tax=Deinococcus sp. 6YEL10 TaxID=2745870 RepID=UPI001E5673DD|nr:hypothetical protein [Deinococcus sp. 6YEL10]MCD0159792.1 hypothetical protein [Deinococcus sp. 6YEL10]
MASAPRLRTHGSLKLDSRLTLSARQRLVAECVLSAALAPTRWQAVAVDYETFGRSVGLGSLPLRRVTDALTERGLLHRVRQGVFTAGPLVQVRALPRPDWTRPGLTPTDDLCDGLHLPEHPVHRDQMVATSRRVLH